jgi:hypothetical protein
MMTSIAVSSSLIICGVRNDHIADVARCFMSLIQQAYNSLDLSPDATPQVARRAYRQLVRVWHPDRFSDDPWLQARAEEKLKEINEAYAVVQEDLASRAQRPETSAGATSSAPPPTTSPPVFHTPKTVEKIHIPKRPAARTSPPAAPLLPFFSSWQNLLFLIFVFAALHQTIVRYGSMLAGAGYALKILSLPLLLALLCNQSRFSASRLLWGSYVAVVSLFGGILMVDAITFSNKLHEATRDRSAPSVESGAVVGDYPGGLPTGSTFQHLPDSVRRGSGGPMAPVPPQVQSPESPQAPAAPIMPAAPLAEPAR